MPIKTTCRSHHEQNDIAGKTFNFRAQEFWNHGHLGVPKPQQNRTRRQNHQRHRHRRTFVRLTGQFIVRILFRRHSRVRSTVRRSDAVVFCQDANENIKNT